MFSKRNRELERETSSSYSNDLRSLIRSCLEVSAEKRPTVEHVFRMQQVESRASTNFEEFYRRQVTPRLTMTSSKNSILLCNSATLEGDYKPVAMRSLKFNQNLIVVLAVKAASTKYTSNFVFSPFASALPVINDAASVSANSFSGVATPNASISPHELDSSEPDGEFVLLIYDECANLVKEFNSYLVHYRTYH